MKQCYIKTIIYDITGLWLMVAPVQATTITIGKGTGTLWEGIPFHKNLVGPMDYETLSLSFGLASISAKEKLCIGISSLRMIAGYLAYPIGAGVGLIPRARVTASYARANTQQIEHMSGTIGLPITQGSSTSDPAITFTSLYDSNPLFC
ncbi:hypothetical protein [Enterobacter sp. CC120223-11]|uniref:hypothetical protein n=1 Tax=Enterobacter sp. CC120223-11 TaxID=1378073 RepID=UPI000BCAB7E3|nr:hypothetical protein [Enterobacter sp. CC120223-11]SNY79877.1 hypothetical protein SAMN02744775_04288 [Enterobacter sp. CC120223-11]